MKNRVTIIVVLVMTIGLIWGVVAMQFSQSQFGSGVGIPPDLPTEIIMSTSLPTDVPPTYARPTLPPTWTPTASFTSTPILTLSRTASTTPALLKTPYETEIITQNESSSALELVIARAQIIQTNNAEWETWYPQGFKQEVEGISMLLVPIGCFMMGTENGHTQVRPVHQQCIHEPYWIDKYEVTQSDFEEFGGTKKRSNDFNGANRPVENITWFEAKDFCASRNARLLTEIEWEYAARGPDGLDYPWGNEWNPDYAIWNDNSNRQTSEVGSRPPESRSWIGAYDLAGNVWEWTMTPYRLYTVDGAIGDPIDSEIKYAIRGGAWYNGNSSNLQSTWRGGWDPTWDLNRLGLRCARNLS